MASDSDDFIMAVDSDGEDSTFGEENRAVARLQTQKTTATAAATKPSILQASTNASKKSKKTVEQMYQKKSPLEHILLRPDTYIGSVERHEQEMFIVQDDRIVQRAVSYTPGLFKIFDEIVVNAADNKQRDETMDKIEICIDREANWLSVLNNGKGVPIEWHKDQNMYVPTLIFGHLLTGSNFDDNEKKTTGGRNGYGAKLANVFSTQFVVECVHTESGKYFQQTFRSNMQNAEKPIVKSLTKAQEKKGDYVKISFRPDLQRFKMSALDQDICGLFARRAYDTAASLSNSHGKRLTVSLNGKKLPVRSFEDYLKCFDGINKPVAFQKTDRWEVGVAICENGGGQISFVNSIATTKGGTHVENIANQIVNHLTKTLKKKKHDVSKSHIRTHLFIFVNCLIENPAFDSQTKENLITRHQDFGSKCKLDDAFLKKVDKSDIVPAIVQYAQFKDQKKLKNAGGTKKSKLTGIPKLDDANFAGTAKSKDCTLIITEGDSAKSLAMAGLSVVGRDNYGVFPLRGKPLNVRDAPLKQVTNNEEIKNLVNILGLKYNTTYDEKNIRNLRYGHLMIMADQDSDGSHIKGLIINLLHNFWPTLLDVPGFLQQFITPIVKVSKGKKAVTFFNLPEYEQWLESTGTNGKGWNIKYYKGLGTSTSAEAKEYFSNLDLHEINFAQLSIDNVEAEDDLDAVLPDRVQSGSDLIDMVFRKTRVEDRKKWLDTKVSPETFLDYTLVKKEGVKFSEFLNKEYILFSHYDNVRSIPHFMDGFKPSQRKVLYGCFKRKLKGEIKVAQLTGYVAEHSVYHHGEQSLQGTIVVMASNYCGSNNINLLTPSGQFGTRRMGGKDAASARYIFTKLEPITRAIFHPDDDELLNYLKDDGSTIEPEYYVPVIPMILVNGSEGIGSGWSSYIPNYNPREIIANLRRMIANEDVLPMTPFYHGFTGEITEKDDGKGSYAVAGKIERTDDTTLLITELPIKKWTQDYKEMLEKMLTGDDKKAAEIVDFKENHMETTVSFTITAKQEKIDEFENGNGGLMKKFKLTGSLSTSNMTVFSEGKLTRFANPEDILRSFYQVRYQLYEKRKARMVENLRTEQRKLSNKARFVEEVCTGDLVVSNRKRVEILLELQERGYDTFLIKDTAGNDVTEDEEVNEDEEVSTAELAKGYEYLLGMKIWSLTFEKAQKLRAERDAKTEELEILEAMTPSDIWLSDLDAIEIALEDRDAALLAMAIDDKKAQSKSKKIQAKAAKKSKKKKKDDWDSDEDSDVVMSDSEEDEVKPKATTSRAKAVAKKPAAKPVPKLSTKKSTAVVLDEVLILSDSEDQGVATIKSKSNKTVKTALLPKRAPKHASASSGTKSVKTTTKKTVVPPEEDDDVMMGLSLSERMKKRLGQSSDDSPKSSGSTKSSFDGCESMDSLVAENFAHASLTPAVKKTAPGKKKVAATKKTAPKANAVVNKRAPQKKASVLEESDSEDEFDFHSDEEAVTKVAAPAAGPRSRRVNTIAKKTYAFSDSDEASDSDF